MSREFLGAVLMLLVYGTVMWQCAIALWERRKLVTDVFAIGTMVVIYAVGRWLAGKSLIAILFGGEL